MSSSQPKAKFYKRISENEYLNLAIWQGKSDPSAEVISVQLSRRNEDGWETAGQFAVYRTSDGNYSQLPDRK